MSAPRLVPRHSYNFITTRHGRVVYVSGGSNPDPAMRFHYVCKRYPQDTGVVASLAANFPEPQRQYVLDYWARHHPHPA